MTNYRKITNEDIKLFIKASYDKPLDRPKQIKEYFLDMTLNIPEGCCYWSNDMKQGVVVHRGTEGTLSDWSNNLTFAFWNSGGYRKTKRFQDARKLQLEAIEKYGANNLTTIGHSQGGLIVELLGNDKDTNTRQIITFNKASRPFSNKTNKNQIDIKTGADIVSALNPITSKFGEHKIINVPKSWNPFSNNALTAHMPDSLDRLNKNGKPINIGSGHKIKSGKVQSVLFNKEVWNLENALMYLLSHGYKFKKLDESENYFRFRQYNPPYLKKLGYDNYKDKKLSDGVILVIAYPNNNQPNLKYA